MASVSDLGDGLRGKKFMITGATGSIGGRLVERLFIEHEAEVSALVRTFAHASRLSRFPVEMVHGDITNEAALDRAIDGCDAVIHCAHDHSSEDANLFAIRALVDGCVTHGVQRLVHVSSMAVYEPLPQGLVSESLSTEPPERLEYARAKLHTEQEALRYGAERGLEVAVVQPTLVYGPFLDYWTMQELKKLRTGKLLLPADGLGLCNAVYVDDVVDSLFLALERSEAVGERFLISAEEPVPWREFYAAYEEALGVEGVALMPTEEIEELIHQGTVGANARMLWRDPRWLLHWAPVHRLYVWTRHHIDTRWWRRLKGAVPAPWFVPDAQRLDLYRSTARVDITKARTLLGYQPAFSFERGMAVTRDFIRWAQL